MKNPENSDEKANSQGPYADMMALPEYAVLDQAIEDLIENKDIVLQTPKRYVVGYLVSALKKAQSAKCSK